MCATHAHTHTQTSLGPELMLTLDLRSQLGVSGEKTLCPESGSGCGGLDGQITALMISEKKKASGEKSLVAATGDAGLYLTSVIV